MHINTSTQVSSETHALLTYERTQNIHARTPACTGACREEGSAHTLTHRKAEKGLYTSLVKAKDQKQRRVHMEGESSRLCESAVKEGAVRVRNGGGESTERRE
eukprot:6213104-Pleurochrysis_carterae.AAC.2